MAKRKQSLDDNKNGDLTLNAASILEYPKDWPPQEYHVGHFETDVTILKEMVRLIESNVSESKIDAYITKNPSLLMFLLSNYSTGHHGVWVIPKKVIKTKIHPQDRGHIPDFIVAGKSSDGIEWFVIELKGPSENIFTEKKGQIYFSSVANQGINQLIQYLNTCDEDQAHLRDRHKLKAFKNPRGILVIGNITEFNNNEEKQRLKNSWNRTLGRVRITTFDAMKRYLKERIELIEKGSAKPNSFKASSKEVATWQSILNDRFTNKI